MFFSLSATSQDAHDFSTLIEKWLPKTRPEKYYLYENKKQLYQPGRLSGFARLWSSDGVWWVRKTQVYGWCSPGNDQEHTLVLHTFDAKLANDNEIVQFLTATTLALRADYAIVHAIPKEKIPEEDADICSVVPRLLSFGLPGVPWLAIYGQPYIDTIGRSKLLTAPAYSVQEVGQGYIACQATEVLSDVWSNRAAFETSRDRIAAHMGPVFYKSYRIQGLDPKSAKKRPTFDEPIVERSEVES